MASVSIQTLGFLLTLTIILITSYPPLTNADRMEDARKAGLDLHNKYRAEHGAPPLELDATINSVAQTYAEKLLSTNVMQHSHNTAYGENLYSSGGPDDLSTSATKATKIWYDEVCNYKKHEFGTDTGHYTQLMWAKSTKLGIGIASSGGNTYVVANYAPAGNMQGSFNDENVPPTSCDALKLLCKKGQRLCSNTPKTTSETSESKSNGCSVTAGKSMTSFGLIFVTTIFMGMKSLSSF